MEKPEIHISYADSYEINDDRNRQTVITITFSKQLQTKTIVMILNLLKVFLKGWKKVIESLGDYA